MWQRAVFMPHGVHPDWAHVVGRRVWVEPPEKRNHFGTIDPKGRQIPKPTSHNDELTFRTNLLDDHGNHIWVPQADGVLELLPIFTETATPIMFSAWLETREEDELQ